MKPLKMSWELPGSPGHTLGTLAQLLPMARSWGSGSEHRSAEEQKGTAGCLCCSWVKLRMNSYFQLALPPLPPHLLCVLFPPTQQPLTGVSWMTPCEKEEVHHMGCSTSGALAI